VPSIIYRAQQRSNSQFLRLAQQTLKLCSKYNVPLLINDRIDIALAVGAAGVHIGQSDMPIAVARRLLPAKSIIGVSCDTYAHAVQAVSDGADYVGIGAVYDTQTKRLTRSTFGPRGVGQILSALDWKPVKAVAIGLSYSNDNSQNDSLNIS
jgi:thiamine-phosphate diphosphorylase / hydroxyethylthiazole kinase